MKSEISEGKMLKCAFQEVPSFEGDADWLQKIRRDAFARFRVLDFPTRHQEAWKTIPLEPVLNTVLVRPSTDLKTDPAKIEKALTAPSENRVVFVNGRYFKAGSKVSGLPAGVCGVPMEEAIRTKPDSVLSYLGATAEEEKNPFSAINTFNFESGFFLNVPENTAVNLSLHFLFIGKWEEKSSYALYPRILVVAGPKAKINLSIEFSGMNDLGYFASSVIEFFLKEESQVETVVFNHGNPYAHHFLSMRARQERGSQLNALFVAESGGITRNETEVRLVGEGARCRVDGLSVLNGRSQVFHHGSVVHTDSNGKSRQTYKNILAQKARSEFNSTVHVLKGTHGTDSNQMNRNLVLSHEARAYSRPQLRIESEDVNSTHGSATGPFEGGELFYLRSRGLDEKTAQYLIAYGFAEELLSKIGDIGLRKALIERLRTKIKECLEPVLI